MKSVSPNVKRLALRIATNSRLLRHVKRVTWHRREMPRTSALSCNMASTQLMLVHLKIWGWVIAFHLALFCLKIPSCKLYKLSSFRWAAPKKSHRELYRSGLHRRSFLVTRTILCRPSPWIRVARSSNLLILICLKSASLSMSLRRRTQLATWSLNLLSQAARDQRRRLITVSHLRTDSTIVWAPRGRRYWEIPVMQASMKVRYLHVIRSTQAEVQEIKWRL